MPSRTSSSTTTRRRTATRGWAASGKRRALELSFRAADIARMPTAVVLDGHSLTLDDVVAVAGQRVPVELAPAARSRMEQANSIVSALVESGAVAYGVTTGFGKLSEIAIPRDRLGELQVNLVRSHAAGVGPLLPERETRAMMLLRANVLAKGYSGARPVLADTLLGMLGAGLYPPIPEQGSVG